MKILIPTRGRPSAQVTADALYEAGIPYTLVRTVGDETVYPPHHDQVWAPVRGIMDKRNWIFDQTLAGKWFCEDQAERIGDGLDYDGTPGGSSDRKILVIDDDVKFYRVDEKTLDVPGREVQGYRYLPCCRHDLREMMRLVSICLDDYVHVGTVRRYGAHNQPQPYTLNVKCLHALGYNLAKFPSPTPRYRTTAVSDFDMQMQLTATVGNCLVLTEFCHEDGPYLAPGGCAAWRTNETIREGMTLLKERWGDYVTLVDGEKLPGGMQAHLKLKQLALDSGFPGLSSTIEERHRAHVEALEAKKLAGMTQEERDSYESRMNAASISSRAKLKERLDAMTPEARKEYRRAQREKADKRREQRQEKLKNELRQQLLQQIERETVNDINQEKKR